jgi:hypothetical protein
MKFKGLKKVRSLTSMLAIVTMLAVSTSASADGPGWTPNSTVKKIVITQDGGINVLLSPEPNNCVSINGYGPHMAPVYPTHPGIKFMKADLLTAYLTGGTVAVFFGDNTCRIYEIILGGW